MYLASLCLSVTNSLDSLIKQVKTGSKNSGQHYVKKYSFIEKIGEAGRKALLSRSYFHFVQSLCQRASPVNYSNIELLALTAFLQTGTSSITPRILHCYMLNPKQDVGRVFFHIIR